MPFSSELASQRINRLAGILLGLALVLLIHRYGGINHDAPLYMGQALRERWPEIFAHDLFFAHGSQGSYTLFPWLLGLSFDWIDPPNAFLWGSLAAILLFAAAGWYCLSGLLPRGQRYWAWLGVLCLPSMYGRTIIFSYHEPFLTPRPIAESLCLLAIGLLARGRYALAIASLACAGVFHPLQAIAAILIIWPWLVMQDRRWLHAVWGAIPILLLAFAGIAPFGGLLRVLDPAWLSDLHAYTGQLFLSDWGESDFTTLVIDVLLLVYAWRTLRGTPFGTWCTAALAGLTLGMSANLILVDWLHYVLPTGLQLWRAHWLAHWFAMATVALLLHRDIAARNLPRAACMGLALLLAWGTSWLWIPFALLYAAWVPISHRVQPRMQLLLGILFVLGMLFILASHVANEYIPFRMAHFRLELYAFDRRVLAFPLVALGLPLLGLGVWNGFGRQGRRLLLIGALCPLVLLAAARWDARSPITLAVEQSAFRTDLFGKPLPKAAQVYWDDDTLVGTWLVLQRASYFSPRQLSGLVFNEGTAEDARGRLSRIYPLLEQSRECQSRPYLQREHCRISNDRLIRACAPGPVTRPDYLVLPYRQSMPSLGSWAIMDPATGNPALTYRLYGCREIMSALEQPRATQSGGPLRNRQPAGRRP